MLPYSSDQAPAPIPGPATSSLEIREVPPAAVFSLSQNFGPDACPPPVEWWFFQGSYRGDQSGTRFFMCTLFRFFNRTRSDNRQPLYHLLVTELDPATNTNHVISQADPALPLWLEGYTPTNLDNDLVSAFRDELREYGVPGPIITGPPDPTASARPFSLSWGDFSLSSSAEAPVLTFPRPGDRTPCRFTLGPASGAWSCPSFSTPGSEGMAYSSIPRMVISGTVGDDPVRGEVWVDHQWGGLGWFQALSQEAGERRTVLGWDWYAITLVSGTSLMVLAHRDMETRGIRVVRAIILENDGEIIHTSDLSLTQSGTWKSPQTGIEYPLAAEITIPGYGMRLAIIPLSPHQEVLIPGPMRAVWEGAACVSGTVRGVPVHGNARVELFGYGYIFDIADLLHSIRHRIDSEIYTLLPPRLDQEGVSRLVGDRTWQGDPQVYEDAIAKPALELLNRNKKYYRPLFATLLLKTIGVDPGPYFALISFIPELTHTGALMIDDIEDNSLLRRGAPCIHLLHGVDTTINAANTLYYLPWLLVGDHPSLDDKQRLLLYRNMVQSAVRAHIGQATDIHRSHVRSPEEILSGIGPGMERLVLQTHADKTGVAGEQAAHACCVIAHASPDLTAACVRFSGRLWTAFQVMDDVRDITGGDGWRKIPGADIASGKQSYVIVKALMALGMKDRFRLAEIIATPRERKDEAVVREGLSLVKRSGAVEVCEQETAAIFREEWREFSRHIPPSESKVLFRAFCRKMIQGGTAPSGDGS